MFFYAADVWFHAILLHPPLYFLPGMKAVCDGQIYFSDIPVILFTATFVSILNLTFSRHIWWKCLMCVSSFCFGTSVIIPKLRFKRSNFLL
jgi:hypothetical protein